MKNITSAQIRAARGLLNISAKTLSEMAKLGVATVRRAELHDEKEDVDDGGASSAKDKKASNKRKGLTEANAQAIRHALEQAGIEFIDANGGGPGVRLREQEDGNNNVLR